MRRLSRRDRDGVVVIGRSVGGPWLMGSDTTVVPVAVVVVPGVGVGVVSGEGVIEEVGISPVELRTADHLERAAAESGREEEGRWGRLLRRSRR